MVNDDVKRWPQSPPKVEDKEKRGEWVRWSTSSTAGFITHKHTYKIGRKNCKLTPVILESARGEFWVQLGKTNNKPAGTLAAAKRCAEKICDALREMEG